MEPEQIEETLKDAGFLHVKAMELADTLDAEMDHPEHEHVRAGLVRRLGVLVDEYANGYAVAIAAGHELGMEYSRTIAKLEAADAARLRWMKLAKDRGQQIDGLTAKLLRRGGKLGRLRKANKFLAEEVGRMEAELEQLHENLTGHLKAKGAELKASRKAHREAAAANLRFADEVARLRRRLRDSNLRKLTLAFGDGGMSLDIGAKVAEPVDEATDSRLVLAIAREVAWAMDTPGVRPAEGAVRILNMLRDVER